jgi:hypothetical protein
MVSFILYRVDLLLGNDLETNTKQHPLLGSRFLISKYMQPLLRNAFANKRVQREIYIYVGESVKRRFCRCSLRIPTVRSRYQGTTGEGTAD